MRRLTRDHSVAAMSKDNPPAYRVADGETVLVETPDCRGGWVTREGKIKDNPPSPNPSTGPIEVEGSQPGEALAVTGLRLALLLPLAIILSAFVVQQLMGLNEYFQAAIFTLLILPPPFIIPLYMPRGSPAEKTYVNNVLTLYTIVTIVLFSIYYSLNSI